MKKILTEVKTYRVTFICDCGGKLEYQEFRAPNGLNEKVPIYQCKDCEKLQGITEPSTIYKEIPVEE